MKKQIILLILLLVLSELIIAQSVNVNGKVTTLAEAAKKALVTFTSEKDTTQIFTTLTDSLGNYSIVITITDVDEDISSLPSTFELAQNYPNPFSKETAISYKLNEESEVEVTIYDILGREVRRYGIGKQSAGLHGILWDGNNNIGEKLTTGVYFYRVEAGKESLVNKMLLVRGSSAVGGSLNLNGSFIPAVKLKKQKVVEEVVESYTVTIENNESTAPRVGKMEIPNVVIEGDTVINFSVYKAPIARAGEDMSVKVGQYVTLDGTGSQLGDGSELKYDWASDTTNPAVVFVRPYFEKNIPGFTKEGTYRFTLVVNDGLASSDMDEIIVEVGEREKIVFEDPSMEIAVRYELEDETGELTDEKLAELCSLCVSGLEKITRINGVEKCVNLEYLSLTLNRIEDLSPISNLVKLREIHMSQNRVLEDISPLVNLVNIEELDISSNNISDITPLKNMTKLKVLRAFSNPFIDIAALENMTEMVDLNLEYPIAGGPLLKNTGVIKNFKKLKMLWLADFEIDDISFLQTMGDSLIYLRLSFCKISDITSLTNCNQLVRLFLDGNNITDITPLKKLDDINILDLKYNQITNIEPLMNISGIRKGISLSLIGNPLDSISVHQYIPRLKERGVLVSY